MVTSAARYSSFLFTLLDGLVVPISSLDNPHNLLIFTVKRWKFFNKVVFQVGQIFFGQSGEPLVTASKCCPINVLSQKFLNETTHSLKSVRAVYRNIFDFGKRGERFGDGCFLSHVGRGCRQRRKDFFSLTRI